MYELKGREMIFILTGPEGSGRKTVADMVGTTLGMKKVISYSTRDRRATEMDGQDYHFISLDQFAQAEEQGEFLESVHIRSNKYGVKNDDIETMFQQYGCIYLILNRDGAEILKNLYGDKVIRIFIYADRNTVTERQKESGLSEDVIQQHLDHYDEDIAYLTECEHAYENYDLAHTVFDITQTLENYLQRNLLEKD